MSSSLRALAVELIGLAPLLFGCGQAQKQAAPPPPTVTLAKPFKRTIVDQDEYVGRFVPVYSVEMRARVSGYLDKRHLPSGFSVSETMQTSVQDVDHHAVAAAEPPK
jgi:multidrug efflux pump subunit AcrA (membrane-fusion protein)